ncbi:MAG: peptide chain release factor N(5)-glutamine methyltransferase [Butyrivibrio sp.]|jgi:release factor glutamine methyltransferase|nr:peptide chain release factor N(5)-glutamine methyltransferase [Butyrivibrio sp.]
MEPEHDITYEELCEKGTEQLKAAGVTEAQLDARLLLESVCGTDHNTLLVHGDRIVSAEEAEAYQKKISARAHRIPLAYITGSQEFMGLTFKVSDQVLIPNQDTETLVEEGLKLLHDGMRFMDLCTGSGCIALSLLHYTNDTTATATDISPEALEIAVQNAQQLKMADRVRFEKTDLFPEKAEKEEKVRADLIISNPPYIPTEVIDTLAPEVKDHEPRLALDGRTDGLDFYRRMIAEAPEWLYESGWLLMEIGYDQGESVSALMKKKGFHEVQVVQDLGGRDRVVLGCWF